MECGISLGDWAACEACAALINDTNLRGLAERTLESILAKNPEMRPFASAVYEDIAALHQEFFRHRLGPAVPINTSVG